MLGEEGDCSPGGHQQADDHQEYHSSPSKLGVDHSLGGLPLAMFPPGEAVANEEGEAETEDQFWKQVLDVEEVGHFGSR
jgi:hypothetical protein